MFTISDPIQTNVNFPILVGRELVVGYSQSSCADNELWQWGS